MVLRRAAGRPNTRTVVCTFGARMQRSEFNTIFGRLSLAFGKSSMPLPRQDIYFQEIQRTGADLAAVSDAVDRIVRNDRYFPTVSELLSAIRNTAGSSTVDASLEYEKIREKWFNLLVVRNGTRKISENELRPLVAEEFRESWPGMPLPAAAGA